VYLRLVQGKEVDGDNVTIYSLLIGSRGSSVSIVTRLRPGRLGFDSRQGFFSLCHRTQVGSGVHPASYSMGTGGSFRRGKAAEE
jgi:hypothetical protein